MDNKPNCIIRLAVPLLLAAFLPAACSLYSHTNIEAGDNQRPIGENDAISSSAELASLNIPWNLEPDCLKKVRRLEDRKKCEADGNDGNFVAMSISGGGSRSAVFSAQVMFELQRYGVLQQVDMISSVSGGSYTAAFYALSCDDPAVCPETVEGPDRFLWTEEEVFPMLQKNFKGRWIANLFWPDNMIRYWFTAYDRTDIMAETLSDNLFDNSMTGNEGFRFQDLNPQRPNLIINATNNTRDDFKPLSPTPEKLSSCGYKQGVPPGCHADLMGLNFTFTKENFSCVCSNLDRFLVAEAVTASAAFPGGFPYVTLADCQYGTPGDCDGDQYIHLFDGGASDNLGLLAVNKWLKNGNVATNGNKNPDKAVILVDGSAMRTGISTRERNPRRGFDYIIDSNLFDAFDTLMSQQKQDLMAQTKKSLAKADDFIFIEMNNEAQVEKNWFGWDIVRKVPTDLKIEDNDAACLRQAARKLVDHRMEIWRTSHPGGSDFLHVAAKPSPGKPLPECKAEPSPVRMAKK